jgi:hypothetical protein
VAPDQAEGMIASLRARGVAEAVAIGKIESANAGKISVTRAAT